MRVEETIRIVQPPERVWAVVADPGNDPRWCRTVKSVDPVGDRRWRVMHKPVPLRPLRELELKQLAAEPPRRLVLRPGGCSRGLQGRVSELTCRTYDAVPGRTPRWRACPAKTAG
jgi:uncharacterized protein YndB with AHSA1/START domain